jgi:deferrochelatase/peroxidase EfeB
MSRRAPPALRVEDIQGLILRDPRAKHVRHLIFTFPATTGARRFLSEALDAYPLTTADANPDALDAGAVHTTLGLTYRGLERLHVPPQVLGEMRARARAFAAGAPLRAAERLGDTGPSAANAWDPAFGLDAAHALFTLHGQAEKVLETACDRLRAAARAHGVIAARTMCGANLGAPEGEQGEWVHFGFRDGLSRVRVAGWPGADGARPESLHKAGEFLLGFDNDNDFNPWVLPAAHLHVRQFFMNGSFGVLRQMEQDVGAFEEWVQAKATMLKTALEGVRGAPQPTSWPDYVKAKLCGRWPDGRRVVGPAGDQPGPALDDNPRSNADDFDYEDDPHGRGCPFGAHVRRMNPREPQPDPHTPRRFEGATHRRRRTLIRRGRPYGPPFPDTGSQPLPRGLLGLFFCASLEDQFEHLLGQWAERPPMGLNDAGNAKDPLMGQHDDPAAVFDIPLAAGGPLGLDGFRPFVRTRGTLYAFHPSLTALRLLLDNDDFRDQEEEPLEP